MMLGPVLITQYYIDGPLKGERADNLDIGFWSVGRDDELRDPENPDDEIHIYHWAVTVRQRNGTQMQYTGTVEHRYGDGWISLLSRMFQAAELAEAEQGLRPAGTGGEIHLEVVPPGPDS